MTISPILPVYSPININFSYGKGVYLYDINGKRYVDFHSGIAVSSLGHANSRLINTLKSQGERLWHITNTYNIPAANNFAEKLINNSFADTAFFANSGSEAVECGLKIARIYQNGKGNKNRHRILTFHGAFHGRTFLTCATNDRQKFSKLLNPYIDWCDNIEPNIESVKKAIPNGIGVILIEPIQGQGGIKAMGDTFMKELRKLCDENDILLFFDCVQCGTGRTGKLFAYEHAEVKPDICALAKGIGGGFPLGVCLATEKAAQYMAVGMHGSTFGGNPLATSVGNAVLEELLSPGFLENVEIRGKYLKNKLEDLASKFPMIEEVRGTGLMLGIKVKMNNQRFAEELSHRGLLTVGVTSDNIVRILPPLIITEKEVDEGIEILKQYLSVRNLLTYINMNDSLVCLGIITSPHGIKGAVKIKTFTEKPENISLYGRLISGNESYKIDSVSVIGNNLVIATISGVNSRNEAELLRNKKLCIERNKMPKLNNENEFYQNDLVDMEVRLENNELYGHVKSIHNFGSGDILEISVISTKKGVMLPFTKEIFPHVNTKEKYIVLNMPEFIG